MHESVPRLRALLLSLLMLVGVVPGVSGAQPSDPPKTDEQPEVVQVDPTADDAAIAQRLRRIYDATPDWIRNAAVEVNEGVVVLRGVADSDDRREWAAGVARRTQDVVAVINLIEVDEPEVIETTGDQFATIWHDFTSSLPMIGICLLILAITVFVSIQTARIARGRLSRRVGSPLLAQLLGNAIAVPVFILGLYLVLRIADLTNLALTVLGGTGLFGLVIGIAFRDIAENYLASILISIRRPFRIGDTIEVTEITGVVQAVTTRGTLVITFDGNHVLIPNSVIYKSVVMNRTANPNTRESFVIGIGTGESIAKAQDAGMSVLREHEAVLNDPAPMVLVEELGASTVNLRVYLWVDGVKHSAIKVKSSVMRQIRRAFMEQDIDMPCDARELVIRQTVPVQLREAERTPPSPQTTPVKPEAESDAAATDAEDGLQSEQHDIQQQARQSQFPDQGQDLVGESDG